jgi:hypothetical protein
LEFKKLIDDGQVAIQISFGELYPHSRCGSYAMLNERLLKAINGVALNGKNGGKKLILMNNTWMELQTELD